MSRTSLQLETAALTVPCAIHQASAGTECPDGGARMDRYGVSPEQWDGWFERDGGSLTATGRPDSA